MACLTYAVHQRVGFAMLTGEVGTGKTMICRAALEKFSPNTEVALITHTSLTGAELIRAICSEFEIETSHNSKLDNIEALNRFLVDVLARGAVGTLIIDEAQNLSFDALEEVRMLGNLETANEKLLQIILVGQPELRQMIMGARLRQLNQRIGVRFHLASLRLRETLAYIDHRIRAAGGSGRRLFADPAKLLIHQHARGIPRLINLFCDQCLLQAYVNEARIVSPRIVQKVVAEWDGRYLSEPARRASVAPGQQALMKLIFRNGTRCRMEFPVFPGQVRSIGRGPEADLRLRDRAASRIHCRVINTGREQRIVDAGSRNGLVVNGQKAGLETVLRHGDRVAIGTTLLQVQLVPLAASATRSPRHTSAAGGAAPPNARSSESP
ncbi:MAG: AAA family ATPase [Alphaproteobacteria bacterium]